MKPTPNSQTLGRAVPQDNTPTGSDQNAGNFNTTLSTVFTKAGVIVPIYTATQSWARIILTLETAGPVEASSASDFKPFLSGKAQALQTGVPLTYDCARGSRLFLGANTVERVKMTVQPLPWLEQITGSVNGVLGALKSLFTRK